VLEAQRQFVANASHQLRTPLTGLRLRLEAASLKAGPELAAELEAAEREIERLARLLTTLLALAREGDRPAPKPVDLAEAVGQATERWIDRAGQTGHELVADCRENAVALASEEDVAIVLDNLIENALKYSPDGGTVRVECAREGAEAYLAVLDEGPGLAPGEEQRLFERFARGSSGSRAPGTGLGLALVATLARRWGGSASIRNRVNGGARAEIRLPAGDPLQKPNTRLDEALPERV
jgi:signal transduction histidine kinase